MTCLPAVYQITVLVCRLSAISGVSLLPVPDENCRFDYAKLRLRFDFRTKIAISIFILKIVTALVLRQLLVQNVNVCVHM